MKLVLMGLVMIANGLISINCSDNDMDWMMSDDCPESDFEVGPSKIPNKKRASSRMLPSSKKVKNEFVRHNVGFDASKRPLYECDRCKDSYVAHFDTVTNHMHDIKLRCFPKNGLPCLDCNDTTNLSIAAVSMLNHNNKFHSEMDKWTCRFCNTHSPKEKWINHIAYYTSLKNAPVIFEGYADDQLKIAKGRYTLAEAQAKADKRKAKRTGGLKKVSSLEINNNQAAIHGIAFDDPKYVVASILASFSEQQ